MLRAVVGMLVLGGGVARAEGPEAGMPLRVVRDAVSAYLCLPLTTVTGALGTWADAAPAPTGPTAAPAPAPSPTLTITGRKARMKTTLTADGVVRKVQSSYMTGLNRCYRTTLAKKASASGSIGLVFTINAVGKTESVAVTAFDPALGTCVKDLVATWRFPIPQSQYAEPLATIYELTLKATSK